MGKGIYSICHIKGKLMKKTDDRERRGLFVLKHWGFWFWLIVWLPGHFKEMREIRKREKQNGNKK